MRYPVLLVHGMGIRDNHKIGYWGRIPRRLEELGCKVFLSGQDCSASVESNCRQLAKRVDEILEETGASKLNIIAHSKGGLESRYLASSCGYADKIASITTLATPHNGSKTVDTLMKFPDALIRMGCSCFDIWFRILGDENPETYKAICGFKTESAQEFNRQNPDQEGIYYQSYAFVMNHFWSDMLIWFPSLVVNFFEGENDGLLPPEAVKWGNYKGVVRSSSNRGISHCDEIDMRRMRFNRKDRKKVGGGKGKKILADDSHVESSTSLTGVGATAVSGYLNADETDGVSDIVKVYENIVLELEEMNF